MSKWKAFAPADSSRPRIRFRTAAACTSAKASISIQTTTVVAIVVRAICLWPAGLNTSYGDISMLNLKNVGDVIASRDLMLDKTTKVTVLIGRPQLREGSDEWYCPYQKIGVGSDKVKRASGVDPIQALALCLSMVGAELYCSDEYRDGRLSWDCGAVKGDLGFPVPPNIQDILPPGAGGSLT